VTDVMAELEALIIGPDRPDHVQGRCTHHLPISRHP